MLENRESLARAVDALAAVAAEAGKAEHGATLFGAAEAIRRSMGVEVWPTDQAGHENTQHRLLTDLGAQRHTLATQRGANLTLDQILQTAAGSPS